MTTAHCDDADKESPGFEWWPGDFCVTVRAHRHVDLATDARVRIQMGPQRPAQGRDPRKRRVPKEDGAVRRALGRRPTRWSIHPSPPFRFGQGSFSQKALSFQHRVHFIPKRGMDDFHARPRNALAANQRSVARTSGLETARNRSARQDETPRASRRPVGRYPRCRRVCANGRSPSRFAGTGEFEEYGNLGQAGFCALGSAIRPD